MVVGGIALDRLEHELCEFGELAILQQHGGWDGNVRQNTRSRTKSIGARLQHKADIENRGNNNKFVDDVFPDNGHRGNGHVRGEKQVRDEGGFHALTHQGVDGCFSQGLGQRTVLGRSLS